MSRSKRRRISIIASIGLHAVLLVSLLFWYLPDTENNRTEKPTTEEPVSARVSEKVTPSFESPIAKDIDVPPDQIRSSIESQTQQAQRLSDKQKLKTLNSKLNRLEEISDQESVDKVVQSVADSMGINPSQYAEKTKPIEGDFDHKSAQIKSVNRTKDESGKWKYQATMVDEQGHQLVTPLSESEGASVYETFETMKKYPMAESLYQKVIMPMLQKMLEAEPQR